MTTTYDLIVVGAGPGGSNAASVALKHGLTVAQFDRHRFPRTKPCGGGITHKAWKALRLDPLSLVRSEFAEVEVNVWGRTHQRFARPPATLLRTVVRSQFDAGLVTQNLSSAGFHFIDEERVLEIAYDGDRFRVRAERQTLFSRQLVGADGVYSLVNRVFSIGKPKGFAVALEVTLRRDDFSLPVEVPPCFDIGAIEPGYGWVFPKDDHWNVGLYTLEKCRDLPQRLTEYIRAKGFRSKTDPLATLEAHRFPYGGYRPARPLAPVYIVGDAGGFGDALTGEGIYHALESGRLAGQAAHDCLAGKARHDAYYRRIRKTILADTFLTYYAARKFYGSLDRAAALVKNPLVWRTMIRSYGDGITIAECLKRGGGLGRRQLGLAGSEVHHGGTEYTKAARSKNSVVK